MTNGLWAVAGGQRDTDTEELRVRFEGDSFFELIIDTLLGNLRGGLIKEMRHAMGRAKEYVTNEGHLWKVGDKHSARTSKVECILSREGFDTALKIHIDIGHWSMDHIKLHTHDRYFWPHIDSDMRLACLVCGHCKGFGAHHQNVLLQLIIRGCPFEFLVTDYLKLPLSKGKMANILFFIDVVLGFVWGQK